MMLKRSFASAALKNPISYSRVGDQPAQALKSLKQVSSIKNVNNKNITLATFDHHGPTSKLAIVLKAGSRYEPKNSAGLSHLTRHSIIRNVEGDTIVRTIREAELRGDTLYTAHTREHLIIGSEFLRDDLVDAVPTLFNNLFNKQFFPYEFIDTLPRVVEETESVLSSSPETFLLDKLHQVAFRNSGLGNSLFASSNAVDQFTRASVLDFISGATANDFAVVGTGVAHEDLSGLVQESLSGLFQEAQSLKESVKEESKYFGGEARFDSGPGEGYHYMIAFPGVAYKSSDYYASLVLSAVLTGAKYNANSVLSPAISAKTSVKPLLQSYADTGLLGLYVKSSCATELKKTLSESVKILKNMQISESALARAKKSVVLNFDISESYIANGVLGTGNFLNHLEFADKINAVSAADVLKLAKNVFSKKPSVSAYGDTYKMPYLDEFY